jgi:hypothetical protein
LFEIALDDAVILDRLASRQTDGLVRVLRRYAVQAQPLRGGDESAGYAGSNHEAVGGLEFLPGALAANISIILLIYAVKLGHVGIGLSYRSAQRIIESIHQGAAQMATCRFDVFNFSKRGVGHQYMSL